MMKARFSDGYVYDIPELTLKGAEASKARSVKKEVIWEGEMVIAPYHHLEVKQRADRSLLLSLYEQSHQRLQLRLDRFCFRNCNASAIWLPFYCYHYRC